ncbi:hypothetical protein [Fulvivirga ligni]|uniref:hypothetical protein n=1 Tax=Fulvivirga ligni TaxID=2904246 RepID=UPI001F43816F|nr:hypothetical protein [Fulvivirga ligni]UII23219.1 hypothetical protein LVD16_08260 [Fulvivirga ligni]
MWKFTTEELTSEQVRMSRVHPFEKRQNDDLTIDENDLAILRAYIHKEEGLKTKKAVKTDGFP